MAMAGVHAGVWRRAIPRIPANGSATKRLPTPADRPAGAAEIAADLADDAMVSAFGAALAGTDFDDAGRAGPQRQHVLGIEGTMPMSSTGMPFSSRIPSRAKRWMISALGRYSVLAYSANGISAPCPFKFCDCIISF